MGANPSGSDASRVGDVERREVDFFADHYKRQAYNLTGWRLRMERDLRLLLRESGRRRLERVLSVGCGDGCFELMAARHADHVTGIDISPDAVELARRNAVQQGVTNVDFVQASLSEYERSGHYDAVLCIGLLHHIAEEKLSGFLTSVFEVLEPGGFFYALDPNANGILRKIGRVVLGDRYGRYHTPDERELDPAEIEGLLREAGFQGVRLLPIDLTLVPATYLLANAPGWLLVFCAWVDRIYAALPVPSWASGFAAAAHKPGGG